MQIKDSVMILTGASAGIGLVTARMLAEQGAKLALAARSAEKLESLASELPGSLAVPTDMTDTAAVHRLVETAHRHFGRIDALINNAGRAVYMPAESLDLDAFRQIFELNVLGPLAALEAVVPVMRTQGGGLIVNITSSVAKMTIPGLGSYAATKSALNTLMMTARGELAKDNIRVSLVYPRLTATDFGRNAITRPDLQRPDRREGMPPADPPELVAERILDAIRTEVAEQYMTDEHRQQLGFPNWVTG